MESKNENVKVPLISKIAYGFGDVGCNFSWMFVSNFLMIFYTDVFGISMAAVSALMLFSRFWDAINDPIVGGLTDKTKNKMGDVIVHGFSLQLRSRPVLLIMTFWAHPDWSVQIKGYLYGNYILSAGTWIYLCKYPVWHPLWSYDTGYR